MSIKSRGVGIPTRSSGGGGAVKISHTDTTEENNVSKSASHIVWRTQGDFGFTVQADPKDSSIVYVGLPANFSPAYPSGVGAVAGTSVRVAEPDTSAFVTDGWESQTHLATTNTDPSWGSGLVTGFGEDSNVKVEVFIGTTLTETQVFLTDGDAITTTGVVTCVVNGTTPDGDGSRNAARLSISLDLVALLGVDTSGRVKVVITNTDFVGDVQTFQEEFFYDNNAEAPVINGDVTITEPTLPTDMVLKYISGVGYYTTGSKFKLDVKQVDNHNVDSSRPTESIIVDAEKFGISLYKDSPWTTPLDWTNVGELNTSQDFNYDTTKSINRAGFRWVGESVMLVNVADSWSQSSETITTPVETCIDTYTDFLSPSVETFNGELNRLNNDYTTSWVSEDLLVDGEACIFGGNLVHPADIHTIEPSGGVLGSANNLTTYKPDVQSQPDYSGFVNKGVYLRRFMTPTDASYPEVNLTISTNGDITSQLTSGELKIYIWKIASSVASNNAVVPPVYDPADPSSSLSNSLWVTEGKYSFADFDDGDSQTAAGSDCVKIQTGNTFNCSFGGFNVETGILMRVEVAKGVTVSEISAVF